MAPLRVGSVRWIRAFLLLLGTRVCYATWPQFDPGMTPQQRGMVDTAFLDAMYMARNVAYTWEPRIDPVCILHLAMRTIGKDPDLTH